MRLLLERGADPDVVNDNDESALSFACVWGWHAVANELLSGGADPGLEFKDGNTPLTFAAQWGHRRIVEKLLARGAKPTITALRWAVVWKRFRVAEMLAPLTDNLDHRDPDGKTVLDRARDAGPRARRVVELIERRGRLA